jgi:peptidyl-prolyl cis-trans isomerase-like 2
MSFHRLVPGFMLQGGDPSGSGFGGESAWGKGKPFRDTFDARILHDARGVLSMANSGLHSNSSQFFITMKAVSHLDYKHTVFGRLVGGAAVLDRIEGVGADKKEKPLSDIVLLRATVFTNPIEEANQLLYAEIENNIKRRLKNVTNSAFPMQDAKAVSGAGASETTQTTSTATSSSSKKAPSSSEISTEGVSVGKYIVPPNTHTGVSGTKRTVADFLSIDTDQSDVIAKPKLTAAGYSDFSNW